MNIQLRKVTSTPLDFDIKSENIAFKGFLQYHSGKLILLKANLSGSMDIECDVCATKFELPLNNDIEFFISDGIYEDEDGIELDVVESLNSSTDVGELLDSELELIRSDYHSCKNCKDSDYSLEF